MCTGTQTVNPDLSLLCVTCSELKHLQEEKNNEIHSQQANKARTYLATCKINREGLAILLTGNNHSTCQLLAAPASTIPEIKTRLDLLIIICSSYHSFSTSPKLTCPQADDTQACRPRALTQTICTASPSPRW